MGRDSLVDLQKCVGQGLETPATLGTQKDSRWHADDGAQLLLTIEKVSTSNNPLEMNALL